MNNSIKKDTFWKKHLPINTNEKIDIIYTDLEKMTNLTLEKLQQITLLISYDINKLKTQLYFKDRITDFFLKHQQNNKKETIKQDSTLIINTQFMTMMLIGRPIKYISQKYNIESELLDLLRSKGFECSSESTINAEMISACKSFFMDTLKKGYNNKTHKNLAIITQNTNRTSRTRSKDENFSWMEKYKKKNKFGPDRLPIPKIDESTNTGNSPYGKEGNWYKLIYIKSR